jgi:hypothetical protein
MQLSYLFVAGLGRRQLGDLAVIRPVLKAELARLNAAVPHAKPVMLASGAAGADQLFLSVAQELGWKTWLVLPVAAHLFERDFERWDVDGKRVVDAEGLETFRRLLGTVTEIEVIPPAPDRRSAFTRCSDAVIRKCDVLVVLWDGLPGKQGGTNESLMAARMLEKPVVVLDSNSGGAAPEWPRPESEIICAAYLRRNDGILRHIEEALESSAPPSLKDFGKLKKTRLALFADQLRGIAGTHSERFRRRNLRVLLFHTLATAVGVFILEYSNLGEGYHLIAAFLKFSLVLAAVSLSFSLVRNRSGHYWVRARFIREIIRTIESTWRFPTQEWFVPSSVWEVFHRLRDPLLMFAAEVRHEEPVAPQSIAEFTRAYRTSRLIYRPRLDRAAAVEKVAKSQREYHADESDSAAIALHRIKLAFMWISRLVLFCAAAVLIVLWYHYPVKIENPPMLLHLARIGTVLLPMVAAALLVVPNLMDWNRRRIVSRAVAEKLAALDLEAAQLEEMLNRTNRGEVNLMPPTLIAAWAGGADAQKKLVEAFVTNQMAEIVRQAEGALLTEVIGFKAFMESVEIG